MSLIKKYGINWILILVINFIFSSCANFQFPQKIMATKGYLDLSDLKYLKDKKISITGEWEFYFNQFIYPENNEQFDNKNITSYINIPGSWHNIIKNGKKLPSKGYATYRLRIKLPDNLKNIGIKIPTINTAYRLYINNTLQSEVGGVSKTQKDSKPKYEPQVILYQSNSNEIEFIFHVSNFHHQRAGINKNLIIGDVNSILKMRENNKAKELFFSGSIFIILIYNLWIFLWRRKEKAMLCFSIFCFLMLIRIFFLGENVILELFPIFNWVLHYRIELLSSFILPPVFCFFIYHLYPLESVKNICYVSGISGCLAGLILFILPSPLFASVFNFYQFIIILNTIYIFAVLVRATFRKRSGAFTLLAGFLFFAYSIINDILFAQIIIQGGYILPFGFFILSIFEFSIHINFVRAKDQLVRSENKIMALLNALPYPMVYFNDEGKILDYKTISDNLFLSAQNNLRGSNLYDFIPKDLTMQFRSIISGKTVKNDLDVFEYTFEESEQIKYYEIRLMRGKEKTYLAIIRDITSSKITEQKLFQADKLAAIGTLVAGVAHEINNPNNSILLMADNFRDDFKCLFEEIENNYDLNEIQINGYSFSEFIRQNNNSLERLKRNSLRIKRIVEDLKDFSSAKSEDNFENVDLNAVIECAVQLLQNTIKNSTNYFSVVKGKVPLIKANFQRLEQVFINLFQNACDSLSAKEKKITTTTSYNNIEESIKIEIKDEGIGMSSATQKNIFDPFFTTKQNSGGLGLGLSITCKIIKSYNGTLEFNSLPGKGTTVIIKLPVKS